MWWWCENLKFISPKLTQALRLDQKTKPVGIRLGDRHKVTIEKKWEISMDLILGVVWLKTLGRVVMDWKELSMEFQQGGKNVNTTKLWRQFGCTKTNGELFCGGQSNRRDGY